MSVVAFCHHCQESGYWQDTLEKVLSKRNPKTKKKNRSTLNKISGIVEEAGGIDYAKKKLDDFSELALQAIDSYPDSDFKKSLVDLVAFNSSRIR